METLIFWYFLSNFLVFLLVTLAKLNPNKFNLDSVYQREIDKAAKKQHIQIEQYPSHQQVNYPLDDEGRAVLLAVDSQKKNPFGWTHAVMFIFCVLFGTPMLLIAILLIIKERLQKKAAPKP